LPAGAGPGGILETLGCIVHGDKSDLANSNVADVAFSIINMLGQPSPSRHTPLTIPGQEIWQEGRCGRRVRVGRHRFPGVLSAQTHECHRMVALTVVIAICYAPTIL